ncbi:MAG: SDR family NAD(P)-dependent oxidoreductase [Chloroflexi bacterium]|nr:SDR family NAD(P)-dependent oxidoreductase [Chloroflexota bacterium]
MRLKGQRVWLIGASSGIGAALAVALAERGATLAISARSREGLEQTASLVAKAGGQARVETLDITSPGAAEAVAARLRESWGAIDMLIYGAGAWAPTDVAHLDVQSIEQQIAVNYVGLVRAIGAVLPPMVQAKRGTIVGIASVSAYVGLPRAEAYGSTKAAINYLLQSLRLDLRRRGVKVITVNPGFVRTPLTANNDFPMPFMLEPEQAARAIVRGIERGSGEVHFPLRLSLPLKVLGKLPRPVYEWVIAATMKR